MYWYGQLHSLYIAYTTYIIILCQALQVTLLSSCTSIVWIYFKIYVTDDGKATCAHNNLGLNVSHNKKKERWHNQTIQ